MFAPRSREFDLETGAGVDAFFEQCRKTGNPVDAVIHSAAYYGGIGINQADPAGLIERNTRMTLTVFSACARNGVRKIVSVGSACAYPGHLTGVMEEKDIFSGRCHDSVEAYGFNKLIHLVFGKAFHRQHKIAFNQVALTNLYGPHDVFREERSHVIAAVIIYTKRWQETDWKEGLLGVGFLLLIFSVGWSMTTFVMKLLVSEKGLATWLDRDTLALLLLALAEGIFFSVQMRRKRRNAAAPAAQG